ASATSYEQTTACIIEAACRKRSLVLAATSVHGVTLASRDAQFRDVLNSFEIIAPDGQPIRWALNLLYAAHLSDRVYGPPLVLRVCASSAANRQSVYFYGTISAVLDRLVRRLQSRIPILQTAGRRAPPSRSLPATAA